MNCPYCGRKTNVVRTVVENNRVRRRRECLPCKVRFWTAEMAEPYDIKVEKLHGPPEPFAPSKILNSIEKACLKLPISDEQKQSVAREIMEELALAERERKSITSTEIGRVVMSHLRSLNLVAWTRYASYYHGQRSIGELSKQFEQDFGEPPTDKGN